MLDEVEAFAGGEYPVALGKGDALASRRDRKALAARLARYTGLDAGWIERADERIEIMHFCRELLAAERKNVGPHRLALHGRQRVRHRRAAGLRPEHRRDHPAVHGRRSTST